MRTARKDNDFIPDMPETIGHADILDHLWTVGPVMAGASGPQPLSHAEIRAWQDNTHIQLNGWEAALLRKLSVEYSIESEAAHAPSRLAPYVPISTQEVRASIAQQMGDMFSAMLGGQSEKVAQ